ncbi:MAG: beta-lactamase family protein [Firmicutes bacterium]|nr:beta-lactamase family protein [Bacillota bacterium]
MIFPRKDFEKASCKDANIDKGFLVEMFDKIKEDHLNIHSLILLKDGAKVFDAYADGFGPNQTEEVYSISKSFTSIAIGICQDLGLLKIQDLVLPLFEKDITSYLPGYETLTITHLLTMSVGQEKNGLAELKSTDNPFQSFFNTPLIHQPGEVFFYNNFASFMLSAIVSKVTSQSCNDFLNDNMYQILDMEKPVWKDFNGINLGAHGLKLNAIDLAKFGLLLLNEGKWREIQVVSSAYILDASKNHITTSHVDNPKDTYGYGYQFWLNDFGDFRAAGWLKQYIVINKEYNLVFVTQAYEERELLDLFTQYIIPGFNKGWMYSPLSLREFVRRFEEDSKPIIENEKQTRNI